jgi:hypothetical protein
VSLKVVQKAVLDPENVPKAGHECTLEKVDQLERRKAGTEFITSSECT